MTDYQQCQAPRPKPTHAAHRHPGFQEGLRAELITPNPKLKLLDPVRQVMRLKHYCLRTETCSSDWIRRSIRFHRFKARGERRSTPEAPMEEVLSDLAVNGHVAASIGFAVRKGPEFLAVGVLACPDALRYLVATLARTVERRKLRGV